MKPFLTAVWVAALLGSSGGASTRQDIPAVEREVLMELYRGTHGQEWTNHDEWNGERGSECEWFGVVCGSGHVQKIALERNGLSGPLPRRLNQLTQLSYIGLANNELTGSIPDLGGLSRLTSVSLNHNMLTGPIPPLTGLTALEFFTASFNQLSGPIPELTGLARLKDLELMNNALTGPIPALQASPLLHDLYLDENQLTGSIPDLRGMNELRYLRLNRNRLSGPIPDLRGAPNLQELGVANNDLSGDLPAAPARASSAALCPNRLTHPSANASLDTAWSKLTKDQPWWRQCAAPAPGATSAARER